MIKRASVIRADLEDSGFGWKLIKTNGHSDCVQGRLIAEFFHTDAASTEDNQNKEPITVFDGFDENGDRRYAVHWRRAMNGGWKQIVRAWRASPQCAEMKRLQEAEGRRRIVEVGRKLLKKFCCPCIKRRGASECDDTITTFVTVNLPLWHRARASYHQPSMGDCKCQICDDEELRDRYRGMSSSLWALQEALMPCGRQHFEPYDLPGEKPFMSYRGCCASGMPCPRHSSVSSVDLTCMLLSHSQLPPASQVVALFMSAHAVPTCPAAAHCAHVSSLPLHNVHTHDELSGMLPLAVLQASVHG